MGDPRNSQFMLFKNKKWLDGVYERILDSQSSLCTFLLMLFQSPIKMMAKFWVTNFYKWAEILLLLHLSHFQFSWDLFSMILEITSQSLVTCQIDKDELENKVKDCMVDKKQKGYFDVYTIQQKTSEKSDNFVSTPILFPQGGRNFPYCFYVPKIGSTAQKIEYHHP